MGSSRGVVLCERRQCVWETFEHALTAYQAYDIRQRTPFYDTVEPPMHSLRESSACCSPYDRSLYLKRRTPRQDFCNSATPMHRDASSRPYLERPVADYSLTGSKSTYMLPVTS